MQPFMTGVVLLLLPELIQVVQVKSSKMRGVGGSLGLGMSVATVASCSLLTVLSAA
jgi:hypothetical protein